jgi:AcrR family transcriptional regulator
MVRPKSARAHDSVLSAALQLFSERGIDATSMDAIAETSGVSKATIYKHWPDKDALCLDVMRRLHDSESIRQPADFGDVRSDLVAILSSRSSERHAELKMRVMPHLMAYAARNPAFAKAWQGRFLEPPRTELTRALVRGIERGELPRTLNVDLAITLLLGPMLYAHLRRRMGEHVPDLTPSIVDAFIRGYAPTTAATRTQLGRSTPPPAKDKRPQKEE